jgi:cytochrome c peroxidase
MALTGCGDDDAMDPGDLTFIPYNPTPYPLTLPDGFPAMEAPVDNPITQESVDLGRHLFYDPILSIDSTVSCSSCHHLEVSFNENRRFSKGVDGLQGTRSSMSLINVGFHFDGLFWDGRAATLEEQALDPVVNPVEMGNDWDEVERRLRRHPTYPEFFRKAYGITNASQIDRDLVVKAIASFERIIVSRGNSRYDRFLRGEIFMSDDELNGFEMYFDTTIDLPDAECGHCHTGPLLTTNEYINNGITDVETLDDYPDKGRGAITGRRSDYGKFKTPTLRNITLTAPYMHDGRFATLEEVLEHYDSGGHHLPDPTEDNVDNLIRPLGLTDEQKQQVLAFLERSV